jgi:hypothetical protein
MGHMHHDGVINGLRFGLKYLLSFHVQGKLEFVC